MNKTELVSDVFNLVAGKHKDVSKKTIDDILDAVIEAVRQNLVKGNKVNLAGLGSFSSLTRSARNGRNPRTGAVIKIAAKKAVRFKVAKALNDSLNQTSAKK